MAALAVRSTPAVLGAAIGAGIILLVSLLASGILPLLLVLPAIVLVGYIIGAVTMGQAVGEGLRGVLIGANAAVNWALASALFPRILGSGLGDAIALGLGGLTLASALGFLSRNSVYQGLLGYLNWLLPASWPIVALGFSFFLLCLLGAATLGALGVKYFKISRVKFDWRTGTLFTRGGWISNLNPIDTAFNMGNFAFVDEAFDEMAIDHESGHTLNLAAFGSLFHLVGTVDENLIHGADALSERLAESHVPASSRPTLGMWA